MSAANNGERIAVLEQQHEQLEAEIHETRLDVQAIRSDVGEIKDAMNRQKGFWAGVTFFASIVGFVLSQVWQFFHKGSS